MLINSAMLFLAIISAALTETSNNTYDNGNRRRRDDATANRDGLRKARSGNYSFKTKVTKAKRTDTVLSYCAVLDFTRRAFVPCLPSGQTDIIASRVRKVGPNVPISTQVYNHQISLVSADCTSFEIEHKVFDAAKNYANLPTGSAESHIFAFVVEVYPTVDGVVLPTVSKREIKYYSVITRGKVEVAELKFNKSLVDRHLPQNRNDLHAVLASVPIEPLHFAGNLPQIIASFQQVNVQDQPGWADLPSLDLNQPLLPVSFDAVQPGLLEVTHIVTQQQEQVEHQPRYCCLSDDEQIQLMEETSSIETNIAQYKKETCTVDEPCDDTVMLDEALWNEYLDNTMPTPTSLGDPTDNVFDLDTDFKYKPDDVEFVTDVASLLGIDSVEYLDNEDWRLI